MIELYMSMSNVSRLPFTEATRNKIQMLMDYALSKSNKIQKIALFGSFVRADQKVTSDIDLLFITSGLEDRYVKGDIASFCDIHNADAVFYSEDQFRDSECLFVRQVRKDGILLWSI